MKHFNKLSYKNNDISFRRISQQKKLIDPIPIDKLFFEDPQFYIKNNLSPILKEIINYFLVCFYNFGGDLYVAQETIAKKYGYCRKQINILLQVLRELGFIDYIYRHMRTCLYRVSNAFTNLEIRKKLSKLFPVLYLGSISSIISTREDIAKKVTQIKYSYEDKLSYGESYSKYLWTNYHRPNLDLKKEECMENNIFEQVLESTFDQSHNLGEKDPDYISGLQAIFKLTGYGKEYVLGYSFNTILWAMKRLDIKKDLKGNPWNYFNKLLSIHCQENNIEPDFSRLPVIPAPITSGLQTLDTAAVKEWLASFSSPLKKGKKQQAHTSAQASGQRTWIKNDKAQFCCLRCVGKYCCGDCELNKGLGPMKVTGKMRLCIVDRKEFLKALDSVF